MSQRNSQRDYGLYQINYGRYRANVLSSNNKLRYGSDIRAEMTYEDQVEQETRRILRDQRRSWRDQEDRERYIIPEYLDIVELLSTQ